MHRLRKDLLSELIHRQDHEENELLIATDSNDNIVGFVEILNSKLQEHHSYVLGITDTYIDRVPKIVNLSVAPKYRRSGLGTLLVERCIEKAQKDQLLYNHKSNQIILTCDSDNVSAINFYSRLGFEVIIEERDVRYNLQGIFLGTEKISKKLLRKYLSSPSSTVSDSDR